MWDMFRPFGKISGARSIQVDADSPLAVVRPGVALWDRPIHVDDQPGNFSSNILGLLCSVRKTMFIDSIYNES